MVYKPRSVKEPSKMSYTGLASLLPLKGLLESPCLFLVWRVSYYPEAQEFTPRKPFFFLKSKLKLKKGELQRIV
jgi:hypothetical protein